MFRMIQRKTLIGVTLLTMVVAASAQTQRQGETFSIQGYRGRANVIRLQGRALVDVQDLARITKGALSIEEDRIILTLAPNDASEPAHDTARKYGFSPAFTRAAIEAMASIREWGGTLQVVVENGYPVGKAMAGNSIRAYEGRAADSIALAAAAASTESDHRGLELLTNEFNNMRALTDKYLQMTKSRTYIDPNSLGGSCQ
jgi:hypothetical protein